MSRSRVDLPSPLRPRMHNRSPGSIWSWTPSNTRGPRKRRLTSRKLIKGIATIVAHDRPQVEGHRRGAPSSPPTGPEPTLADFSKATRLCFHAFRLKCRDSLTLQARGEMGLFLSMSGVIGAREADVEAALKEYSAAHLGRFEPTTKKSPSWRFSYSPNQTGIRPLCIRASSLSGMMPPPTCPTHSTSPSSRSIFMTTICGCTSSLWRGRRWISLTRSPTIGTTTFSNEDRQHWMGSPAVIARWSAT